MILTVEPCRRTLSLQINAIYPKHYFLWLPYLLFVYQDHSNFYVGFAKEPIKEGTKIYFPAFPNFFDDGHMCVQYIKSAGQYPEFSMQELVDWFWRSSFADSHSGRSPFCTFFGKQKSVDIAWSWLGTHFAHAHFGGYENWQNLSKNEVLDRVNWDEFSTPYEKVMQWTE